jgi:hypothetical protein
VATDPPADLTLAPVNGEPRTIDQQLTTFQLAVVVLDPFTNESSWLLETAGRILSHFSEADARIGFLLTCTAEEAKQFLGPWAQRVLVFADPDRNFPKAVGLNELPAIVHIRQDRVVLAAAEGWDPVEWRAVAESIAAANSWSAPHIPLPGDPTPFAGSAAAGV